MVGRMIQRIVFIIGAALIGITLYWMIDIVQRGGPMMILIIMCSVFGLAITAERFFYFSVHLEMDSAQFFERLRHAVQQRTWDAARDLCDATKGPVARITKAGLLAHEESAEGIERVMEERAHEAMPQIEGNHRWLSTIAQVSTLLGLLGTVIGMVVAFQVIQSKATGSNPVSPADLAGGIWQALITTAAGLGVAIPMILSYNYLAGQIGEVQHQMERAAAIVSNWRRAGASGAAPQG